MHEKDIVLRLARKRRSIRSYRKEKVDLEKLLYAIKVAIEAPSGANQQPWAFIIIDDERLKKRIRKTCEELERNFYKNVKGWLREWLLSRGFSWRKPFLTDAPYLIVVLSERNKPYAIESTWLAIGYLLLALEERGLASLTYTPPNAKEIIKLLGVPESYELQTIIPVGLPAENKQKEPRKGINEVVHYNMWNKYEIPS